MEYGITIAVILGLAFITTEIISYVIKRSKAKIYEHNGRQIMGLDYKNKQGTINIDISFAVKCSDFRNNKFIIELGDKFIDKDINIIYKSEVLTQIEKFNGDEIKLSLPKR